VKVPRATHECTYVGRDGVAVFTLRSGRVVRPLRVLPFGGVYVAGGIALKILPKLKDGTFVRAFSDKIQLSSQLAKIPIYLVLNEDAPVLGAAYEAIARASATSSSAES